LSDGLLPLLLVLLLFLLALVPLLLLLVVVGVLEPAKAEVLAIPVAALDNLSWGMDKGLLLDPMPSLLERFCWICCCCCSFSATAFAYAEAAKARF
jgi:hypothetical protein